MRTVAPGGESPLGWTAGKARTACTACTACTMMYASASTADGSGFVWQHSAPVSNGSEQQVTGHQMRYVSCYACCDEYSSSTHSNVMLLDSNPTSPVMMMTTKAQL